MAVIEVEKEVIECNDIVAKVQRIKELQESLKVTPIKKSKDILTDIIYMGQIQTNTEIKKAYIAVVGALSWDYYNEMLQLCDYIQEYVRFAKLEDEVNEHNAEIKKEIKQLKKELGIE